MATSTLPIVRKMPNEVIAFHMNFKRRLESNEAISALVSYSIDPSSEVTVSQTSFTDKKVQLTLNGGVLDKSYRVEITVMTDTGNVHIGVGTLEVVNY